MPNDVPVLRVARTRELDALRALVARSWRALAARSYAPDVIEAALGVAIRVDPALVEDGTYFVAEIDGQLAACGGWSARVPTVKGADLPTPRAEVRAMFVASEHTRRGLGRALLERAERAIRDAGFDSAYLVATHSGLELYRAAGYVERGAHVAMLPGGVAFPLTLMSRSLAR
ncbi:GNAT family N-acetyltransferase [Sandaracinus amylolyticus]|uniref:Acetyltransferase, GNAT family n=1 Tax=Sandaracinus amylolyticus TaxID=927083 RepID=A0A0F6W0V1_9BACT|nr:GNAT family N-acetyltransferase [Sandaracinus amylolyticus]AKF04567.1 acetyltransferase, GNAT family [Sandaracinus amylolyticus]